ncbi:E3 SUMO-protein ligase ZBED1-like [Andrena cerasifolii]|uniref:E3 SUMO-protein ligase ZBED1-like n=1 Tax=Andrena cerasifolii TaxID=2819439 RepID=UPI0040381FBC
MPSWVWDHCKKSANGQMATCLVCDSVLKTHDATTPLAQHLQSQHQIYCPSEKRRRNEDSGSNSHAGSSDVTADELVSMPSVLGNETAETLLETPRPQPRSRRLGAPLEDATALSHPCSRDRIEVINQALAKMIAINMLPASFAASLGFARFMRVVEPAYKPPCAQTITRRLQALHDDIAVKIKEVLASLSAVAISADNWTSRAQDGYLTVQARFINKDWKIVNVTLTTEEMSERHTIENLAARFTHVFLEWGIENIISGIVTDNASNIVGAVLQLPNVAEKQDLTCSVHTLQLCINVGLSQGEIKRVCSKASAIVTHFRHSNVATAALEKAQIQRKLKTLKLIQSVKTRWNSTFFMAERLVENKIPVVSVLADKTVTNEAIAIKLEMTATEWGILSALVTALRPVQIACELLCVNTSSVSMVHPILNMLVTHHLLPGTDDAVPILEFKDTPPQLHQNVRFLLQEILLRQREAALHQKM